MPQFLPGDIFSRASDAFITMLDWPRRPVTYARSTPEQNAVSFLKLTNKPLLVLFLRKDIAKYRGEGRSLSLFCLYKPCLLVYYELNCYVLGRCFIEELSLSLVRLTPFLTNHHHHWLHFSTWEYYSSPFGTYQASLVCVIPVYLAIFSQSTFYRFLASIQLGETGKNNIDILSKQ